MSLTLIIAGGQLDVVRPLPPASFVIAADSGLDHAHALGVAVDVVVGDLDSVSASGLDRARAAGVRIEAHRPDKDMTDLELALLRAGVAGAGDVLVLGVSGGRRDHEIANLLLLAAPRFRALRIDAWLGATTLSVVHDTRVFAWAEGDTVTILPLGGDAHGVRTQGLEYPLRHETLAAGSSRGVSNVVAAPPCEVSVAAGALLVVHVPAVARAD